MRSVWILGIAWWVACSAQPGPLPADPAGTVHYLTPTEHLLRASMALRGIRPSLDDLHAVASDPSRLPAIVDRYLASAEFGTTVRALHNEVLLVRTQRADYTPPQAYALADVPYEDLNRSFFEEPLRLIEDVVMTDQPYTAIVTADYTMADRVVATVWGMPHSADPGWERTVYTDGRPPAGILDSAAIALRYRSAANNFHRGRANAFARALLCFDFLAGDVKIDASIDLSDPVATTNALTQNPSCAACHQTLDPLASYFFPFSMGNYPIAGVAGFPVTDYVDMRRVDGWFLSTNRPPGYFGQDVRGLDGLGRAMAADPRFARCAATNFASYLTQTPAKQLPATWINELQGVLASHHMSAKQLARAIVLSDRFRVASDDDPQAAEGVVGYQKVRPQQYAAMLEDLTGFAWRVATPLGEADMLDDDLYGFRVLAGGIDSFMVTRPVATMNATSTLAFRRAALLAATYVVDHDRTSADRILLVDGDLPAQLRHLHARIFGELDDADIAPEEALWQQEYAATGGDARRAWIITLVAMLTDVKAVYY